MGLRPRNMLNFIELQRFFRGATISHGDRPLPLIMEGTKPTIMEGTRPLRGQPYQTL
jgi:hypothetical protein